MLVRYSTSSRRDGPRREPHQRAPVGACRHDGFDRPFGARADLARPDLQRRTGDGLALFAREDDPDGCTTTEAQRAPGAVARNVADSRAFGIAGLPFGTGAGGAGGGATSGRSQPLGVDVGQTRIEDARSFIAPRSAKKPVEPDGAQSSPESGPV